MRSSSLHFGKDDQGLNAFAPIPTRVIVAVSLTAGVAASFDLPTSASSWIVSFSTQKGTDIWVDFTGDTAAVPVGGTFSSTTSEQNPGARAVATYKADGTLNSVSVISANATCNVSVSFYSGI